MHDMIQTLRTAHTLSDADFTTLLQTTDTSLLHDLRTAAQEVQHARFGNRVYVRGLIEISNLCKNDCLYCGIRRSNARAVRYRLTHEQILACCAEGAALGFRTFVLQGGEDAFWSDDRLCLLIQDIKQAHPQCAVTLSLGERGLASFTRLREAGADRYLLRHETADPDHYARLHPPEMSYTHRMACLHALRTLGYQVGAGMMVGSPFQTTKHLITDLHFLADFQPEMIGIGPFLPHAQTPFAAYPAGSTEQTLRLLSILRLMLPDALIPSTTALAVARPDGFEQGVCAGANVIMLNLTPPAERCNYALYDGKSTLAHDTPDALARRRAQFAAVGYTLVSARGDFQRTGAEQIP